MSDHPSWDRDGRDWPNRAASRFVQASGLRWHVQQMGQGPALLLVHGTGAATHSWRTLAPLLGRSFNVLAPDLPGHGFTQALPSGEVSLPRMSAALGDLLQAVGFYPSIVVGHSAGAAILARMSLDRRIGPLVLVSLNGAFLPFRSVAGQFFSPLAKLLVTNPLIPRLFAWRADRRAAERLLRDTGSTIDPEGIELYAGLLRHPGHVAAALNMMAGWDLEPLVRDLPALGPKLVLVAGGEDRAIAPDQAFQLRDLLPSAQVELLRGLGHLAHEERPDLVADLVTRAAQAAGVLPPP